MRGRVAMALAFDASDENLPLQIVTARHDEPEAEPHCVWLDPEQAEELRDQITTALAAFEETAPAVSSAPAFQSFVGNLHSTGTTPAYVHIEKLTTQKLVIQL